MLYALLADLIVALHIAYVVYVVGGLVAILIGALRGRKWIRNPWFRVTHLLAILIVVMEIFLKLNCPLTTWENQARAAAQHPVDGSAFMDRLLSFILIAAAPRWVINGAYFVFAVAIAATFFWAPPSWKRAGKELAADERGDACFIPSGLQPADGRSRYNPRSWCQHKESHPSLDARLGTPPWGMRGLASGTP